MINFNLCLFEQKILKEWNAPHEAALNESRFAT